MMTKQRRDETHRYVRVEAHPDLRVMCPLCGMELAPESIEIHRLAEEYVLEKIRADHPEWIADDGACPKCVEFYRAL